MHSNNKYWLYIATTLSCTVVVIWDPSLTRIVNVPITPTTSFQIVATYPTTKRFRSITNNGYNYQRTTSSTTHIQPLILDTLDYLSTTEGIILPHIQELSDQQQWFLPDEDLDQQEQQLQQEGVEKLVALPSKSNSTDNDTSLEQHDRTISSMSLQQDQEQQQRPKVSSKLPSNQQQTSMEGGDLICRVITRSDRKLSAVVSSSSSSSSNNIQRQLDDIYHAKAYQQIRQILEVDKTQDAYNNNKSNGIDNNIDSTQVETTKLVASTIRQSLEDAGYELLSRRDLDLCEALNAGYLLRLSILPDVLKLDPTIVQELYPDKCDSEGNILKEYVDDFLFDQRVLVYWRGYSKEITRGRLLLPKLDYLQASLVQRLFGNVRTQLGRFERFLVISTLAMYRNATACFIYYMRSAADQIPNKQISKRLRKIMRSPYFYSPFKALNNGKLPSVSEMKENAAKRGNMFTLSRYGGTKTKFVGSPNPRDALNPFIICEEKVDGDSCTDDECYSEDDTNDQSTSLSNNEQLSPQRVQRVNERMYESLNNNEICCPYDKTSKTSTSPPMQLLERVSISNLVDIFTKEGRRSLFQTMFSKSELVEPTYEEVVVVWRPINQEEEDKNDPTFVPPKFVYDMADMFNIRGLPQVPTKESEGVVRRIPPLEIRTFEGVPMANLPAVLPKTKLIFRPADAFVFDLISILSFVAIIGSVKFDNPKLDLIAIVSVGLWLIRTLLRYSNKLARYDLLVKKFLTSKITYRNIGALQYIINEAGQQRSKRAALMHMWLTDEKNNRNSNDRQGLFGGGPLLLRSQLIANAQRDIQNMIQSKKRNSIDVNAALNDLEDLNLIRRLDNTGQLLEVTRDESSIYKTLKRKWASLFTPESSINKISNDALIDKSSNNNQ